MDNDAVELCYYLALISKSKKISVWMRISKLIDKLHKGVYQYQRDLTLKSKDAHEEKMRKLLYYIVNEKELTEQYKNNFIKACKRNKIKIK